MILCAVFTQHLEIIVKIVLDVADFPNCHYDQDMVTNIYRILIILEW